MERIWHLAGIILILSVLAYGGFTDLWSRVRGAKEQLAASGSRIRCHNR
jgi:hypothetical protein